jgi:hypothetical protein
MRYRVLTGVVVASVVLSGCASSFRRTGYAAATQKATADCRVVFKQEVSAAPDEIDVLGSVTASDSGFSIKCDEAYVLRRFRDDACAVGADVVRLSDEKAPDFWSTCYRAKAELLRYRDRDVVQTLTSDARYDPDPLRERSDVTYDRLRDAAIGGAIAGPAGAVAAGAIGN